MRRTTALARKIEFEKMEIDPDFPGYTHQDVHEQVRKMYIYLKRGLNPFTEQPYGFWETNRYTDQDIEAVKQQMLKYLTD
jgi:hypothetical protein